MQPRQEYTALPSMTPSPSSFPSQSAPASTRIKATKLITLNGNQYLQSFQGNSLHLKPSTTSASTTSPSVSSNNPTTSSSSSISSSKSMASIPNLRFQRVKKKPLIKPMDSNYCYYFHRFGQCRSGPHCPYLHDPTRITLCRSFLFRIPHDVSTCPFNHTPTPQNTPLCHYFQSGKCTVPSCLFLHVKVATSAPLCASFQLGFCSLGARCTFKHLWSTKKKEGASPQSLSPSSSSSSLSSKASTSSSMPSASLSWEDLQMLLKDQGEDHGDEQVEGEVRDKNDKDERMDDFLAFECSDDEEDENEDEEEEEEEEEEMEKKGVYATSLHRQLNSNQASHPSLESLDFIQFSESDME